MWLNIEEINTIAEWMNSPQWKVFDDAVISKKVWSIISKNSKVSLEDELELHIDGDNFNYYVQWIKVWVVVFEQESSYIQFIGTINGSNDPVLDNETHLDWMYRDHFDGGVKIAIPDLGFKVLSDFFINVAEPWDELTMRIENPKISRLLERLVDEWIILAYHNEEWNWYIEDTIIEV